MTNRRDEAEQPVLPARNAFVVHFREAPGRDRVMGRVEHVVSGESARFTSWEELWRFAERVLTRPELADQSEEDKP